jgi:Zn-dependent peptidase ImmA (M78 family)/transcriptional regulator with XRE-family HTH domain
MMVKRLAEFVPARLTQARRVCGWTMAELASRTRPELTRQAVSSFEKGTSSPSLETLRSLARELNVEPTFLTSPLRSRELEQALESAITFRTLASSTKRAREQAWVYLKWLAGIGEFIEQFVELPAIGIPDFGIDDFSVLDDDQIEEIAALTRKALGLGDGPISDLTLLLENKGVFIGYVSLAHGMDGISAWIGGRPTVLISERAFAARARLDLAHELAHLILHRALTNDELETKGMLALVEHQAQYFASCFLMPETTFASEIYGVDEDSLIAAKKRWGVSMQAIIMRLNGIGLISERQKVRWFQQISAKGQRKKEPLDGITNPERGRLLRKATEFIEENRLLSFPEFFDKAKYPPWYLETVTGLENVASAVENVVPFRLKTSG